MASDLHARRFIVFLLLLATALTGVLVMPFWGALFLAAALAAAIQRWMEWLARKLGGRRPLASAALTIGVLLVVVIPVTTFGALIVSQVLTGVAWLREVLQSDGISGLVARLPGPIEHLARRLVEAIPDPHKQLQALAGARGGEAAAAVGGLLVATGSALFQAAMMLIALFFFLADGPRLIDWLDVRLPLRPGQFRQLAQDFRRTTISVLVATIATAGIQTATALVGFLIARVPNVVFLTFATFIVALIPALGATVMLVVVGVIILATGHLLAGIFLIVWGIAVVSIIDNVARPYLLKGGLELNGGVVFFALLGGLAVFGAIGLVIGPLIVTFLLSAMNMYWREFGGPGAGGMGPDARAGVATDVTPGAPPAPAAPPGAGDPPGGDTGPTPIAPRDASGGRTNRS